VAAPVVAPDVLAALRSAEPEALGVLLGNDLQAAAFALRPGLEATLEAGMGLGALGAVVCGSGPTCAFLVHDAEHALDVAVGLAAAEVSADVVRATGPVPGARVLT
jgi:4-diphosphocytidyl-2-C-methyl-D-erythritol kinase